MVIFILGVVEMFIIFSWTKTVVESKVVLSGIVTIINILIWTYVLRTFVEDINNIYLVFLYAFGCATGTMLSGLVSKKNKSRRKNKVKQALTTLENTSLVVE